jgi:hypothetical protein
MNYNATSEGAEPRSRELSVNGPPAPTAHVGTSSLAHLKNRLLRETLEKSPAEPLANILRLAATEAEAQAWLTSFPLLTFPVLFEEKAWEVRSYLARQERLRARTG